MSDKYAQVKDAMFKLFEAAVGDTPSLDYDMGNLEFGVEGLWAATQAAFSLPSNWTGDGRGINGTFDEYIKHVEKKWDGKKIDLKAGKAAAAAGE